MPTYTIPPTPRKPKLNATQAQEFRSAERAEEHRQSQIQLSNPPAINTQGNHTSNSPK